jgi:regulator of sigma D
MTAAAKTQDRRKDLGETLEALKEQRQQTLMAYCNLTGVSTPGQNETGELKDIAPVALGEFLNVMVDYIAMGHFTVYQRIIEGKERRGAVQEAADRVYPSIGETTDIMVEFNDKYENFDGSEEDQAALREDISRLGEMLAIRGDLEDEILQALLS